MRLIFNASSLLPPLTGVGQYAWHLLEQLQSHPDIEAIYCFNGLQWVDCSVACQVTAQGPSAVGRLKEMAKAVPGAKGVARRLRERLFARRLGKLEDAVYLEPNFVCLNMTFPAVPVIHDLSHIHCPEYHPAERVRWLNDRLAETVARCRQIVTVSQFSKRQICEHFALDPARVTIASPGVSDKFFVKDPAVSRRVIQRYGLKPGYLLTVGALEPRKNLMGLIDAFEALPDSLRRCHPLVVVGPPGWKLREIRSVLSSYSGCDEVVALGYVPQDDLPHIYAEAAAFAYPSFYEGFGMPLLEAMAQGLPVLTSDRASMPEVVGTLGLLANPRDAKDLSASLERLLTDAALQDMARRRGPERAREFTWEKTADTVLAVLKAAR